MLDDLHTLLQLFRHRLLVSTTTSQLTRLRPWSRPNGDQPRGIVMDRRREGRKIIGLREEDSMRLISFSATVLLTLLSSAAIAQQSPTTGDPIGHPPQIPGPPPNTGPAPISEPSSTTQPAQGYTGAYGPPGPATPYYTGPIQDEFTSTGRAVVGPDGSTKIVNAVPCTKASRETDGFTTCIGLPAGWRRR